MKLEVRNISVGSLVTSAVPIMIFVLALLGSVITYFVQSDPQLKPMSVVEKLLSVGIYSLLYTIITSALLVFSAFVYNIFNGILGLRGLILDIEEIHDPE